MELAEWASRYGLVAGITTRGHGFSLGLWSDENVGQVMSRWRAVGAAVRPRFPGVILAHQVHGTTVQWHPAASDGWLIVDGVDGHATGARSTWSCCSTPDGGGLREASWSAAWSS